MKAIARRKLLSPSGLSRICLFRRYASRIWRLMRFRFTARLKRRLDTLTRMDTGASTSSTGSHTTRKGKIEKEREPPANIFSIIFFLFSLSGFRNLFTYSLLFSLINMSRAAVIDGAFTLGASKSSLSPASRTA